MSPAEALLLQQPGELVCAGEPLRVELDVHFDVWPLLGLLLAAWFLFQGSSSK